MQNYYIIIEDRSLVSHKLSIIKYVVLKKIIFFFLCFDRLIWTWTWTWTRTSLDSVLTRTRTSLDSVLTRTRTSLDSVLTRTRTFLDLDLSWTRQRWTWLQPYVLQWISIVICRRNMWLWHLNRARLEGTDISSGVHNHHSIPKCM